MAEHRKDPERVAAGYKASIHNPNVSEEAKEHAQEQLHKMGADVDRPTHHVPGSQTGSSERSTNLNTDVESGKNEGNVIGGYKATLKNPRISNEAKQHAEEELEERGVDLEPYEDNIKGL